MVNIIKYLLHFSACRQHPGSFLSFELLRVTLLVWMSVCPYINNELLQLQQL